MVSPRPFTHAGATLIAERRGSGEPTYVLVHGIGMGRSVFGDLVAHLGERAEVIALDLPGYGEAPEPRRVLTMERTADLVAAYLRTQVNGPVILVGHSMGAQVALEVAARHPRAVDLLVLLGPSGDPRGRHALRQVWRLARDLITESPRVIAIGAREYVRAGPRILRKFRAMTVHRPERMLAEVRCPTLVIRGENDLVAPLGWCRRIAEGVADGRVEEIPGHGHETMIRDASPAAALVRRFAAERG